MTTREAWRAWLSAHHATASEVWLRYAKRHTGEPRVEYAAAVEEALCFGWIDGLVRTVNQFYYAQRFSPRRPGSQWSALNRARFAKLLREGRVTKAGLAQAPPAEPVEPREAGEREPRSAAVPAAFSPGAPRQSGCLAHLREPCAVISPALRKVDHRSQAGDDSGPAHRRSGRFARRREEAGAQVAGCGSSLGAQRYATPSMTLAISTWGRLSSMSALYGFSLKNP